MANGTATQQRQIQVSDWKARENKTLRGFFTITFPNGMIIHDCMLHQKEGRRWVGLPSREYESQGERKFAPVVSFTDRASADRFNELVLAALDKWEHDADSSK